MGDPRLLGRATQDRISAQEYDIQKRIWLQRIAYTQRDGNYIPSRPVMGQPFDFERNQIGRAPIPERHEPTTRPSRSTRRTPRTEHPPLNSRGIDRGPDIIPPFVSNVEETPLTPPVVYLESSQIENIQEETRRVQEELRLNDARAVQSQRIQDDLNSIVEFWSSFGRFVTGDENAMRQYDDIYNWGNESNHEFQGSVMGIGIGASRFVRGIVTSFIQLYDLIRNLPWETLRLSNSDDYIQTLELLQSIAESEIEDPAMSREILNGIGEFFNNIGNRFVRAIEYAENGNNVESSAQIIEGTLEIIDLIDMVGGALSTARRTPQTIRRLTNLRAARMKMTEAIVFIRLVREEGLLGRHVDNFDDVRMSVSPFGGGINIPITRRSHRRRLPDETITRGRSLPSVASHEQLQASVRARRIRDFDTEWASNFTRQYELERTQTGALRVQDRRIPTMAFREWALDQILASPNHPLAVLIDPVSGNFLRPNRRYPNLADHFTGNGIEMGHTVSRHAGGEERLALQWSYSNQLDARTIEAHHIRGIVENQIIEIGRVPIEFGTAIRFEIMGWLPIGTCANAPVSTGWNILDWGVRRTRTGRLHWYN